MTKLCELPLTLIRFCKPTTVHVSPPWLTKTVPEAVKKTRLAPLTLNLFGNPPWLRKRAAATGFSGSRCAALRPRSAASDPTLRRRSIVPRNLIVVPRNPTQHHAAEAEGGRQAQHQWDVPDRARQGHVVLPFQITLLRQRGHPSLSDQSLRRRIAQSETAKDPPGRWPVLQFIAQRGPPEPAPTCQVGSEGARRRRRRRRRPEVTEGRQEGQGRQEGEGRRRVRAARAGRRRLRRGDLAVRLRSPPTTAVCDRDPSEPPSPPAVGRWGARLLGGRGVHGRPRRHHGAGRRRGGNRVGRHDRQHLRRQRHGARQSPRAALPVREGDRRVDHAVGAELWLVPRRPGADRASVGRHHPPPCAEGAPRAHRL